MDTTARYEKVKSISIELPPSLPVSVDDETESFINNSHTPQNYASLQSIPPNIAVSNDEPEPTKPNITASAGKWTPIPLSTPSIASTPIVSNDEGTSWSCTFCKNGNNILRLIILLINLLFICICLLYAFGQISKLELDDYFCEPKTLEEIRQHSIDNNLNEGTTEGCWTTANDKVDEEKLFNAGSYLAYHSKLNLNAGNIVKCVLFLIMALVLIIIFIMYFVKTLKDCHTFWKGNWSVYVSAFSV